MRVVPLLFICLASSALAQPAPPPNEVPPPPPMATPSQEPAPENVPPPENGAEVIEPQVTIVRRGADVVEEYRISGQLYMIKIIPKRGFPYFLIDNDGDGSLETRRNELSNPEIPQWVLFRW